MPDPTTPNERRRLAHAIVGYQPLPQKKFAEKCGLEYNQLRNILNARDPAPSTDDLRILAAAAGLPDEFAVYGFRVVPGWAPGEEADEAAMSALEAEADHDAQQPDGTSTSTRRKRAVGDAPGSTRPKPDRRSRQ